MDRGFTLIEMLIVIAVAAILMSIATLNFGSMQSKSQIEKEVATIYSNLVEVRSQALYTRTPRAVLISGKQLKIYPTSVTSGPPLSVVPLPYPVLLTGGASGVTFDDHGLMMDQTETAICVDPSGNLGSNPGNTDAVDVAAVKIFMGKRKSGDPCAPSSIEQK